MKKFLTVIRRMLLIAGLGGIAPWVQPAGAQTTTDIRIVQMSDPQKVEILSPGATLWTLTQTNQVLASFTRVRIGQNSSATIRWSDQSVLHFGALTEIEILPPDSAGDEHGLNLLQGILAFFHKDKPGRIRVIASGGVAGIKGTEFVMSVAPANGIEQTTLSVIDGQVSFANAGVTLELTNREQAVAAPGRAPVRTAGFIANNILQWCFYYPGVLDLNDLPATLAEKNIFSESLAAYRAGDLLGALAKCPNTSPASSDDEKIYHAAVLLNGGQIADAEKEISQLTAASSEKIPRLASALRQLIAAVKHEPCVSTLNPEIQLRVLG